MKKVIFICLLSLSMCLSKPADTPAAPAQGSPQNVPATPPKPEASPAAPAHPDTAAAAAGTPSATDVKPVPPTTKSTNETSAKNETQTPPAPTDKPAEKPADKPAEKPADKPAEKPADKPADNNNVPGKKEDKPKDGGKVDPNAAGKPDAETKPNTDKPAPVPSNIPADHEKKDQTTVKPEVPTKPTETPSKEGDKPMVQARGFDGPSFIGGIILTLGLLAIGFMGFKYYKNQTERNYHTL